MPEDREGQQQILDFFKSMVQKVSESTAIQGMQKQADLVASTIGGHVREVLGPVQEGVDVIKGTFQNTMGFMKGTMDDLGGFFGLDEKIEEKIYRGASLDQGADIIEENKIGNSLTIKAQELGNEQHNQTVKLMNEQMAIGQNMVDEYHMGADEMAQYLEKGNDIAEADLKQKHEERLEEMRDIEKKDKGIWARIVELLVGILLAPLAIITGLFVGFATTFGKVLLAPLKLIRGVFAVFVPALKEIFSFKGVARWISRSKFLQVITKPLRMIQSVFTFFGKNKYLMGLFKMTRWIGSKVLFPLFIFFDAIAGLRKYKQIFGKGAGMKEMIESAIAGIISGLLTLPAKAFDWTMKKVLGIETDLAKYFDIETIAKLIDGVGGFFKDNLITPVKNWLEDPVQEAHFKQLGEDWDKANAAIQAWIDENAAFFKSTWERWFGTEESRKESREKFEQQTALQKQVELAGVVEGPGIGDEIQRMSAEDIAAAQQQWQDFKGSFMGWFEKNFGEKDWAAQQKEQTTYLKTIAEKIGGVGDTTSVQNVVSNVGAGGGGQAGGMVPREESATAGVNVYNKPKL